MKSLTGQGSNSGVTLFLDDNGGAGGVRVFSQNDGTLAAAQIWTTSVTQYKPHLITIIRTTTSLALYDNGVLVNSILSDSAPDIMIRVSSRFCDLIQVTNLSISCKDSLARLMSFFFKAF